MASLGDKMSSWQDAIRRHGFSGSEERFDFLAGFLLCNEFDNVAQLRGAPDPNTWEGADRASDGAYVYCTNRSLI